MPRRKIGRRVKCSVCGLYRGRRPHSGAVHDRIRRARRRIAGRKG